MHTHQLWFPEQDAEWILNHEHHSSHHHARMHNSPSMSARGGCRMDMKPWAPFQSQTCQNAQLTDYKCQSRRQNWHETISTIPVANMPECTTHQLWLPKQDEEWTLNHEHHFSHHHARMHNSPSMSARGGCRMDMKLWAPFQSPTCQNAQLTNYEYQRRMQNGHETMSTIPVTNMPECTTHWLWVPQMDAEWTLNHEQHSSCQHARMHNSPTMSAREGCRIDMKPWAPFQSSTHHNAQLTDYECQSRMQNQHKTMSTIPSHQHARLHSSPPMSARAACTMSMKPWAPFQSPTCKNAQLTDYECQSRMQNGHEIISTIPVTNMPKCTAHQL